MVTLTRTVRFCVSRGPHAGRGREGRNTYAAWPAMVGLGAFYEVDIHCRGTPDDLTGYLVNIAEVDAAVRAHLVPLVERAFQHASETDPATLLSALLSALEHPLHGLVEGIEWRLTPYHRLMLTRSRPQSVLLTQSFDFAAAHRLNCAGLSPADNQRLFGKCNNPSGHGHNYRVDVAVAVPLDSHAPKHPGLDHITLEQIVHDQVISRFDHKNLDLDTPEFKGRNSSVENIAQACFTLLEEPLHAAGAELQYVTVWETAKTSATFPARV